MYRYIFLKLRFASLRLYSYLSDYLFCINTGQYGEDVASGYVFCENLVLLLNLSNRMKYLNRVTVLPSLAFDL